MAEEIIRLVRTQEEEDKLIRNMIRLVATAGGSKAALLATARAGGIDPLKVEAKLTQMRQAGQIEVRVETSAIVGGEPK